VNANARQTEFAAHSNMAEDKRFMNNLLRLSTCHLLL